MTGGCSGEAYAVVGGARLYVDAADARGAALVARGVLHRQALAMWHRVLDAEEWSHVIDVGANYGEMLLGGYLPVEANVVAVEPNRRVLPYLRRSLAEASVEATLFTCAVSDRAGTATFYEDRTWSGNSTLCARWVGDQEHHWEQSVVETVPFSALLRTLSVTPNDRLAIKIDIEGHEMAALRDAVPVLYEVASFAVMCEVVRLSALDLTWIGEQFEVWCYEAGANRLLEVTEDRTAALSREGVYRRDIVLRPLKR